MLAGQTNSSGGLDAARVLETPGLDDLFVNELGNPTSKCALFNKPFMN